MKSSTLWDSDNALKIRQTAKCALGGVCLGPENTCTIHLCMSEAEFLPTPKSINPICALLSRRVGIGPIKWSWPSPLIFLNASYVQFNAIIRLLIFLQLSVLIIRVTKIESGVFSKFLLFSRIIGLFTHQFLWVLIAFPSTILIIALFSKMGIRGGYSRRFFIVSVAH